ncbi:hypothetical protein M431DRAFT_253896 [Trichoderma harzianum CBS 226.95]|uniref:Uncharacterized protein n=1 Tax=Trichoderma harzianum CBS 226.95 TaxID=983964 RepID=A0A2T4A077_TRIHA|nr:hypothetical protein M431DRAFT_253896 [Trichoderma harzianum CBS 226.95]PTB50471.1 hypothetical protein M431DRAFT_253896 [Trichoderma harzianum CBS 226.95]
MGHFLWHGRICHLPARCGLITFGAFTDIVKRSWLLTKVSRSVESLYTVDHITIQLNR